MPVKVVVGAQWGDEGKGKVVDYLAARADMVIRFQGGPNAGHTVINEKGTFKLHGIPSGIFRKEVDNIMAAGTVLSPPDLLQEIRGLQERGVDTSRLFLSRRAHVILPYHRTFEEQEESALGTHRIGTTGRGVGPTYADKYRRLGICVGDMAHPTWLKTRLEDILRIKNTYLNAWGAPAVEPDELFHLCRTWYDALRPHITDTLSLIHKALADHRTLLLEGQLGAGRCIEWGCYPYVTSSSPTAGTVCVGAGIPPRSVTEVIGVVKTYSSAVGAGPMVVRDETDIGPRLREIGHEYGATTGRPRKCGWLDAVMIRHAARINGFTSIAVTRLDVLDSFDKIGICTAYRYRGKTLTEMPTTPVLNECEPVYTYVGGWQTATGNIRSWDALPEEARRYLEMISTFAEAPISLVSVGPHREETIFL